MIGAPRSDNAMTDMAAVMSRVRKMSDSQLADILAGKDVSVPQFAAMTEAMGRRQLRDAVKGAQAQQQAQQPSVKDQLMLQDAQEAGLAALPAPNMESMDMAGGGIIAFEQGGDVPRYNGQYENYIDPEEDRKKRQAAMWERVKPDSKPYLAEDFRADAAKFFNPIADFFTMREAKDLEKAKKMQTADKEGDYPMYTPKPVDYSTPAAAEPDAKKDVAAAPAAPSAAPATGIAALGGASKFERRANPFADMRAEATDYEKLKSQGLGEGLMKAGAGLLSAPGTKGFAAGIQALAESGAVSRKEIAGLKKDARDYDLNIAKAREAAEQGNDELALKYETLAEQAKYRAGVLGIQSQKLGMLKEQYDSVKIPQQLSNIYAKATDAVKAATAMRPVKPAEFQKMVDAEYRKRASSTGLGKYVDMYSPSAPAYNVVQSPKGAKQIIDPFADEG